jgi:hypothetical protein
MEKVRRYASKTSLAIVVLVTLELFILNPAVAVSDCNIVCEGSFVIDDIDTAADLEALSVCTTVTDDLSIEYSPLTSLEGLECLAHVGVRLDIKLNDSLTSIAGLESVEYVGGDLGTSVNRSLSSLAGLNNLESVGGNLVIWYSRNLCTNLAEALRDRLLDNGGIGGSIHISINKPGCQQLCEEVAAGHPVIVLQNIGLSWYLVWHYAVVVGYDLHEGTVIFH